jgi:hypothetical protein
MLPLHGEAGLSAGDSQLVSQAIDLGAVATFVLPECPFPLDFAFHTAVDFGLKARHLVERLVALGADTGKVPLEGVGAAAKYLPLLLELPVRGIELIVAELLFSPCRSGILVALPCGFFPQILHLLLRASNKLKSLRFPEAQGLLVPAPMFGANGFMPLLELALGLQHALQPRIKLLDFFACRPEVKFALITLGPNSDQVLRAALEPLDLGDPLEQLGFQDLERGLEPAVFFPGGFEFLLRAFGPLEA